MRTYEESGRLGPRSMHWLAGGGAVWAVVVGILAGVLAYWDWDYALVFPVLMGIAVGYGVSVAARWGHCRRSSTVAWAAGVCAVLATLCQDYTTYRIVRRVSVDEAMPHLARELERPVTDDEVRAMAEKWFDFCLRNEYLVDGFAGFMVRRVMAGARLVVAYGSVHTKDLGAIGGFLLMLANVVFCVLGSLWLPERMKVTTYCENCERWLTRDTWIERCHVDAAIDVAREVERVQDGGVAPGLLADLEPAESPRHFGELLLKRCEGCGDGFLTVKKVTMFGRERCDYTEAYQAVLTSAQLDRLFGDDEAEPTT